MNFNFSKKSEYTLNTSLAEEMINLYGVSVKFLVTEKINRDDFVFGDYSHLKTDSDKIYEMFMLPENSEDWDSSGYNLSQFGLTNFDNVSLFVAKSSFEDVDMKIITGNLLVFPNNKVMEITNTELTVPGVNNLFTYNDAKSVYKLTCKPYDFKLINELDSVDISVEEDVSYDTLDNYFNELVSTKNSQDSESEIVASVQTVEKLDGPDSKVQKPIIDNTEDSVFGGF